MDSTPIVTFIYASQTGNCEEISLDMHDEAIEKGYKAERYQFDEHLKKFDLTQKNINRIVILIVSSTGDGEAPDNGAKFYRYLLKQAKVAKASKDVKDMIFSHLNFTILGLGDSDYKSFHKWPKDVHNSFEALGAKLFHYFAKADEAVGLELEIEPWQKRFWPELKKMVEKVSLEVPQPSLEVSKSFMEKQEKVLEEVKKEQEDEKPTFECQIVDKELIDTKFRKILWIKIKLMHQIKLEDNIQPGSYCAIYPENDKDLVLDFIKLCNWEPTDELIRKFTVEHDFCSQVNKHAIPIITKSDDNDKFLNWKAEYSYYDLVKYLHSDTFELPLSVIDHIPLIKPRYYSLWSDLLDTDEFELCFNVEEHNQKDVFEQGYDTLKLGVCSNYLNRLSFDIATKPAGGSKTDFSWKFEKKSMFDVSLDKLSGKYLRAW